MPAVRGTVAEGVRQHRDQLQGQRFLQDRQPGRLVRQRQEQRGRVEDGDEVRVLRVEIRLEVGVEVGVKVRLEVRNAVRLALGLGRRREQRQASTSTKPSKAAAS